jgi:hypothetical protein
MKNPIKTPGQKWKAALLAALAAFIGYLLHEYGIEFPAPVPKTEATLTSIEPPRSFGWVPDPAAVAEVKRGLRDPEFRGTEAYLTAYGGPDDVFLWDACRQVRGDVLPTRDQGRVGACVAFGTAAAIEHLICIQIASGSAHEFREIAQEVIYGGSRVEIGGNRIRGDGSVGAWAARFVREYGVLDRGVHGRHDLARYDERRCRQYGHLGVPDDLEPLVRKYPVRSITNVRSWSEARAAIQNGYPVTVCSSRGFTMERDADGFCRPQGLWFHCLALVGVKGGARPGGFLLNSWGPQAHRGPNGAGRPPPSGFWCDAAILDRMLAEGDSWAFSEFVGFPARRLNWYVRSEREAVVLALASGQ